MTTNELQARLATSSVFSAYSHSTMAAPPNFTMQMANAALPTHANGMYPPRQSLFPTAPTEPDIHTANLQNYRASWLAKDPDSVSQTLRTALDQLEQLEAVSVTLRKLTLSPIMDGSSDAMLSDAAGKLESSTVALREITSAVAQPIRYNERHSTTSTKNRAQEVLQLPELLEMILSFLDVQDVLQMQGVSRTCFSSIEQSSRLQLRLGLKKSSDGFFSLPLESPPWMSLMGGTGIDFPGFACYVDRVHFADPRFSAFGEERGPKDTISVIVRFTANALSGKLPIVANRYRAMTVAQPPVMEMNVYTDCCAKYHGTTISFPGHSGFLNRDVAGTLTNESGVTIDDLYDIAAEVVHEHHPCPDAVARDLDNEGNIAVAVTFAGKVKLRPDDPLLAYRDSINAQRAKDVHERSDRLIRMQDYVVAKKTGR